jgi:hypothetical protein
VLVGVVDLYLRRSDFYEKELTFQVACGYGPGRYDPQYEQAGHDISAGLRALDRAEEPRGDLRG